MTDYKYNFEEGYVEFEGHRISYENFKITPMGSIDDDGNIFAVPVDFGIRFWDAYKEYHQLCPKCKSNNIEQTTKWFFIPPDRNKADCLSCGWSGIVDNLIRE